VKKYVLLVVVLSVLFAASAAQTQTQTQTQNLKFYSVRLQPGGPTPPTIHFFCGNGYDKDECLKDIAALRKAIAPYPLQLLGDWSYYLVMAGDWKPLVRSYGGDSVSPAFTLLLGRATVLDRSLFSPTALHTKELETWSGLPIGEPLIDLAVTHEMGHGICQEKNERKADDYGKELRDGKIPGCVTKSVTAGLTKPTQ